MRKQVLYKYLGTNGEIVSPIHLEDVYYIRLVKLLADAEKVLTKDNKNFYSAIIVPEDDIELWREV